MHIPDAVHHFKEHLAEARDNSEVFSIWAFIQDHYSNPDSHSHDDTDSHDSLPLQHIHNSVIMVQAYVQPLVINPVALHVGHEIIFDTPLYFGDFQLGIYHPPI